MRIDRGWVVGALVAAVGCSDSTAEQVAAQASAISNGTLDTTHTGVVAVFSTSTVCSGSIVQVRNSAGYVLTAAHCCNTAEVPTYVVAGNDYNMGNTYSIISNSVYYDSAYQDGVHDFCMLRFAGANGATPVLHLVTAPDALAVATSVDHVGYGATAPSNTNSKRRKGNDSVTALDAKTISFAVGGPSNTPGPCEGDDGGPVLVQQLGVDVVVGVDSYGSAACGAQGTAFASRVSSALGATGFLSSYLADTPIGCPAPAGCANGGGGVGGTSGAGGSGGTAGQGGTGGTAGKGGTGGTAGKGGTGGTASGGASSGGGAGVSSGGVSGASSGAAGDGTAGTSTAGTGVGGSAGTEPIGEAGQSAAGESSSAAGGSVGSAASAGSSSRAGASSATGGEPSVDAGAASVETTSAAPAGSSSGCTCTSGRAVPANTGGLLWCALSILIAVRKSRRQRV